MNIREQTERYERETLSEYAKLSSQSEGRLREEAQCEIRTVFQRDRDRIIHSKAFRRLKHKTQVFLSPEGDHYRTRLTHTLEVSQIARTIARALRLNEDLTEAIALGHDLGHTPFGHAGERALCEVSSNGFRHYEQSVRVADKLEKNGAGLNLTLEVRDGILCHTTGKLPSTLEGVIVRLSDRIAYINHDIDDSIRAGILSEDSIPTEISQVLGRGHSIRLNCMIKSVVENSTGGQIRMEPQMQRATDLLHEFMYANVYRNPVAKSEEGKAERLIRELYAYYMNHLCELPPEYAVICAREGAERGIVDYIASMSDRFAIDEYMKMTIPRSWEVK